MEENKYITFHQSDIIEALEDYYEKKTNEKMSITFDEKNVNGIAPLRSITVSKTVSSPNAILKTYNPETLEIKYDDGLSKSIGGGILSWGTSISSVNNTGGALSKGNNLLP